VGGPTGTGRHNYLDGILVPPLWWLWSVWLPVVPIVLLFVVVVVIVVVVVMLVVGSTIPTVLFHRTVIQYDCDRRMVTTSGSSW
jgi:hypothetical protein